MSTEAWTNRIAKSLSPDEKNLSALRSYKQAYRARRLVTVAWRHLSLLGIESTKGRTHELTKKRERRSVELLILSNYAMNYRAIYA